MVAETEGPAATYRDRPPLIITADDLGRTSNVNRAIIEAFRSQLISSTSIMASMPAFKEACELVRAEGLDRHVGLHLNLTQGTPLTAPIRSLPRLCHDDGTLRRGGRTIWRLSHAEEVAIQVEAAAQIEAVIAEGIRPSHLDSHHAFHVQWPVGAIVASLARLYGIPAVRLARNCGSYSSPMTKAYRRVYNARLARAGVARTRHFGAAADVLGIGRLDGPAEVMVHPEVDPTGLVVDCVDGASRFDTAVPLEQTVSQLRLLGRLTDVSTLLAETAFS